MPVIKVATNTAVAERLSDLTILTAARSLTGNPLRRRLTGCSKGARHRQRAVLTKADRLGQHDFCSGSARYAVAGGKGWEGMPFESGISTRASLFRKEFPFLCVVAGGPTAA